MKRKIWLAAALALGACSRREPLPPPVTPQATASPEVPSIRQPLQVGPPPPRTPDWKVPAFEVPKPNLSLPSLPALRPQTLPWKAPALELPEWRQQSWLPNRPPTAARSFKQDWEGGLRSPKKDLYSDLKVPGVGDMRSVLDDYERQQQAQREKYVPFPIPVSFPIPF